MSFWPLPRKLADELRALSRLGPLIELGAGDGALTRRLRALDLSPLQIDLRFPPSRAPGAAVRGDACRLPLRDAGAAGIIVGNTLRHLDPADRIRVGEEMHRCLASVGLAVILEDEPVARNAAEHNYRRSLELLAQLSPGRGALLGSAQLETDLESVLGVPRWGELLENEEVVEQPLAAVEWMLARAESRLQREALDELSRSIERDGIRYGRYWVRVYGGGQADGRTTRTGG